MTEYISAFLIGLISAGHCLGMCGGLMLAAGLNSQSPHLTIAYNSGRLTTYTLLGALFGYSSSLLPTHTLPILKFLSSILLLLTALYFLGKTHLLVQFEKIGVPLWRRLQPLTKKLLPIKSISTAFCLGAIWGLIPCGLVYTALAFSLASGDAMESMLRMICFGLGTLPIMLTISFVSASIKQLFHSNYFRILVSVFLIISALILFLSALRGL